MRLASAPRVSTVPVRAWCTPALTYLEEIGYASVVADGTKKLYQITAEGRAHLEQNRGLVDTIIAQLRWVAEKMEHVRHAFAGEGEHWDSMAATLHDARARLKAALAGKRGATEAE